MVLDECDKYFRIDGSGVDPIVDEAAILTDCRNECKSLHLHFLVINLDSFSSVGPSLRAEGSEGEHCLVKVNHLCF